MQLRYYFNVIKGDYGYIYYKVATPDKPLSGNTYIKSSKEVWKAFKSGDTSSINKYDRIKLNNLKSKVDTYLLEHSAALKPIDRDELQSFIRQLLSGKQQVAKQTVYDVLNIHYQDILKDKITNNGKPFSNGKKIQMRLTLEHLSNMYLGRKNIKLVTDEDFKKFNEYLFGLKLSKNTASNYNIYFRLMFKETFRIHKNPIFKESGLGIAREELDYAIALTIEELQTIKDMQLRERYIPARDKFLYGCNIGLRFSDMNKKIDKAALQGEIIAIPTSKTNKNVHIPMRKIALEIWDKYNGDIPIMSHATFSIHIKEICRLAGLTEPVLITKRIEGKKTQVYIQRYQLVTTHTMRRTWATNANLAGVPLVYIQNILGHKSPVTTMKYLRQSNKQLAESVKDHAYFKEG